VNDEIRAGDPIRIDPSEPCAECGVPLGSHPNGMAIASRADRSDHAWSMFSAPPVPYVKGGEFEIPQREEPIFEEITQQAIADDHRHDPGLQPDPPM
jgi:hypothetical protein